MNKQFETLQTELAAGEPQLEALLQRLHQLDRFAWRMNLLNSRDSMLEHLFTKEQAEVVAAADGENKPHAAQRLTTSLAEMIDSLEQHVGWVMQAMNRWCLTVLAWEIVLLALVASGVISEVIDVWFSDQVMHVLRDSEDMAHLYQKERESLASDTARVISKEIYREDILKPEHRELLKSRLARMQHEYHLAGVEVFSPKMETLARMMDPELSDAVLSLPVGQLEIGRASCRERV